MRMYSPNIYPLYEYQVQNLKNKESNYEKSSIRPDVQYKYQIK